MSKTLKEVVNKKLFNTGEKYYPGIPGERKFFNAHKSVVFKNMYSDSKFDPLFNGSKVKPVEREKERHGYSTGKDAQVQDTVDSTRPLDSAINDGTAQRVQSTAGTDAEYASYQHEGELTEGWVKGKAYRHNKHGIVRFSHINSDGHPVFEKSARRGGKQSWPIAVKDKSEVKSIDEEISLDEEDDHKEGDLVLHKGKPKRITKIIPKGSKMMNHKGEHFTTTHTTLRLDQGKRSWPADVKPHEVKKYNMNREEIELHEAKKFSATHLIHHDGHAKSAAFADEYHKGHKIDHCTTSDEKTWQRHQKSSDLFHTKYHEKHLNYTDMSGLPVKQYTNRKTGETFHVHKVPNGKGFGGTDHIIHYHGKSDEQ